MFQQPVSRRDWIKLAAAGVAGVSASGWFGVLARQAGAAAKEGVKHKSCILLWMAGGPAQSHTFDPKPGGEFKPIGTAVPGIQVSEHLPKIAARMKDVAILRGMSTGDGNHQSASYLMHTGFRKGSGGVVHPSLGAIVSHDLGHADSDMPNFVAVGNAPGSGYLGPKYSPLIVRDLGKSLPDLTPAPGVADLDERASLVEELDRAFLADYGAQSTRAHQTGMARAMSLMKSSRTKAFELDKEPPKFREAYHLGPKDPH